MKALVDNILKFVIPTVLFITLWSCSNDKEEILLDNPEIPDTEKMSIIVTITNNNLSVKLPFTGKIDCEIEWGDGHLEAVLDSYPTHTYAKEGTYVVVISGTVTSLYSGELSESELSCITAVYNWGNTGLTSFYSAFEGCTNLAYIPNDDQGSLKNVTDFHHAFSGCSSLTEIPAHLFNNCIWATSFNDTFSGCSGLIEIPSTLFNNCTRVKSFNNTFAECSALTEIPTGLFDKCTFARDFSLTFSGCENLTGIPTGLFDNCKEIVYLLMTFAGCKNLTGESPYIMIGDNKVHLYDRNRSIEGFVVPQYYYYCFKDCAGLSDYEDMPEDWK